MPRGRLLLILIVAFAVRLGATIVLQGLTSPPNAGASYDQVEYEAIAAHVVAGEGYAIDREPTAARPPGTSFAIAVPYAIAGRSYAAARLWFIVLSSLTCVIAAMLAARCAGATAGTLAGVWLAVYPGHLYYAMHLVSEPVFGFFVAGAALLAIDAIERRRVSSAWLAGLCLGCAVLTRIELLLLIPLAAGAAWYWRRRAPRSTLTLAAHALVVAVLIVTPWVVRNAVTLHAVVLSTQRGFVWWGAHNERTFTDAGVAGTWVPLDGLIDAAHPLQGSEVERDKQAYGYGMASIRRHWTTMPYLTAMKVWRLISPAYPSDNAIARLIMTVGWSGTVPFVVFGAWLAVRRDRGNWRWIVVALPLASAIASSAIFYGLPRFRDAFSPLFVALAAYGAEAVLARAHRVVAR